MLKVENISTYYDKVEALHDISITVEEGEIVSIIGANGAGKTTLMKSISGIITPKTGRIEFLGEDITRLRAHKIVKRGIVYIPEGREIFAEMSVQENLEMGAYSKRYSNSQIQKKTEEMYDMFTRLKERRKQLAGSLSGGEQQMLAICRGLMSEPKLIMFDEPSLGLAPVIVDDVFDTIVQINKEKKIPILIVEQNAYMALSISKRGYVIENGNVKISGESTALLKDENVKAAYLGG